VHSHQLDEIAEKTKRSIAFQGVKDNTKSLKGSPVVQEGYFV
jgi:hypothetical protein